MKHLAVIQSEFLKDAFIKEARKWNDLTLDEQRAYIKRHPKTKRRLTARPSDNNHPKRPEDAQVQQNKNLNEMKLKEGQKVRLKPNKSEGWPEEFGVIESIDDIDNDVIMVRVDKKYRDDASDDGLREVGEKQIEVQSGKESVKDIDAQIEVLKNKRQELEEQSPKRVEASKKVDEIVNRFSKDGYEASSEFDGRRNMYQLNVTNKKGFDMTFWLKDDGEFDGVAKGMSSDIPLGDIGKNYEDLKEIAKSINKSWMKENDEGEQW